ncbi:hypothetical protein CKAN_02751700 [Cinnamomum micranthum f. kanehirae]|uniref:Uncharacterized protein n=1 Tax=Cinnamomum micranthum f. kanehirae TaxID=337451 RepID=A0A3S3PUM1_9MAGN|nr:hypothetical protein CKAN_02751700 [Cinnamomum micranthum f. kanehirae]
MSRQQEVLVLSLPRTLVISIHATICLALKLIMMFEYNCSPTFALQENLW